MKAVLRQTAASGFAAGGCARADMYCLCAAAVQVDLSLDRKIGLTGKKYYEINMTSIFYLGHLTLIITMH